MSHPICPMPLAWDRIHKQLLRAWEQRGDGTVPRPPVPLILNGWVFSTDSEKQQRWKDTLMWGERYGFSHYVPLLAEDETYFGESEAPGA